MNISSVIVIPHPERIELVRQQLESLACVELHAVSPEGKMIITLETEGDRETTRLYEQISLLDGVMSTSMVYHQQESDPETVISVEA
ncbi:MAG: chaperone NapD [Pseudomonadota bacterium]